LKPVFNGGRVTVETPRDAALNSFYSDLLEYVCFVSLTGRYSIKVPDEHYADKVCATLGYNNVVGDLVKGYSFKFA